MTATYHLLYRKAQRFSSWRIVIATDGMYSGIVEKGPALNVPTTRLNDKQTIVAGKLKDESGNLLDEVTVTVTDKTTGAKTTSQFKIVAGFCD